MANWIKFAPDFLNNTQGLALNSGQLDIWHVHLNSSMSDQDFKNSLSLLSKQQQNKALRFKLDKSRYYYAQAQVVLRVLLGKYLNIKPEQVLFVKNSHGKPFLDKSLGSDINFNISHSASELILGFVRKQKIGVDLEHIVHRPYLRLAKRFFSEPEYNYLKSVDLASPITPKNPKYLLNSSNLPKAFYNIWTRKEAYVKSIGVGLSAGLGSFSVSGQDKACFLDAKLKNNFVIESFELNIQNSTGLNLDNNYSCCWVLDQPEINSEKRADSIKNINYRAIF